MRKSILILTCAAMIVVLGAVFAGDGFSSGCIPNFSSNGCTYTVQQCVPRPSCFFSDCLNGPAQPDTRCSSGFSGPVTHAGSLDGNGNCEAL